MSSEVAQLSAARAKRARLDPEAAATVRLAKAIDAMAARLGPAADAIVGFEKRLDTLCIRLKKWGPWGLAWWEALLRAADQQASRDNDQREAKGH